MKSKPKVLIISNEIVDTVMAGPGIRYYEIARVLSEEMDVTLAIPGSTQISDDRVHLVVYSPDNIKFFRRIVETFDTIIVTPFGIYKFPWLANISSRIIVDLYDPFILENLFYYLDASMDVQIAYNNNAVSAANQALKAGDYFICGSERQRDYWLGALTVNGRLNPLTFTQDADLRALIDVVGIGIPLRSLTKKSFLKGIHPAFPSDAQIVLWGGGVWDWLDPITLLKAWDDVAKRNPLARLVFLGTKHPNSDVPGHRVVETLENLAIEMGVKGKTVFFFEWLSYEDREALLGESDIGVVLHPQHIETHFSIRTRVLDYIWAKIPIIVSEGDVTSEWVKEYHLGHVVKIGDILSVKNAINDILKQPKYSWYPYFESVLPMFTWSQMITPLKEYCLSGEKALDWREKRKESFLGGKGYFAQVKYIYKHQGLAKLLLRIWSRIKNYLSKL